MRFRTFQDTAVRSDEHSRRQMRLAVDLDETADVDVIHYLDSDGFPLHIEVAEDSEGDVYYLTIGNHTETSRDREAMERQLYAFAESEGYF